MFALNIGVRLARFQLHRMCRPVAELRWSIDTASSKDEYGLS